jgi:tetratricopeptide (TPR) repeat protein/predicted Ser/Thr protein kinase
MTLEIGDCLGRYEILAPLGAGGMGEVYRARDTELERDVAIKVIREEVASDPDRIARFRLEARAAAQVSHPNIAQIFDFVTENDTSFVVMEYLEGKTLRETIHESTPGWQDALRWAVEIADGVAAAHRHGVVHRDLKPENILLTVEGHLKVLDFGLARFDRPATSLAETGTMSMAATGAGMVMGTPGYMAPEQVRGARVDSRADVFAIGCVLYEMLAGDRAFCGTSDVERMAATLRDEPTPVSDVGVSIPVELERVLTQALAKDPEERYEDAGGLLDALRSVQDATEVSVARRRPETSVRERTWRWLYAVAGLLIAALAVILLLMRTETALAFESRDWILVGDFDNQTGEPLFDRALLTAFTVSLEQSQHVNVFPRSRLPEVLKWMGRTELASLDTETGREICQRANIHGLVTSAIGRIGDRYSLTARLVDPATGLAVRSYAEEAPDQGDILDALGRIAGHVRRDLGESLLRIRRSDRPLAMVTTPSLEALRLYTDARLLWDKGEHETAVTLYRDALEHDPDFAMAHAALGSCYMSFVFLERARGKEHFEKALALTDRTTVRERLFIEATFQSSLGHRDEAIRLHRSYLASYPDDIGMRYNLGNIYMNADRSGEAIGEYREVLRVAPRHAASHINIATCYVKKGVPSEALSYYEQAFELEPRWLTNLNLNNEYGFALVACGEIGRAREVFALALEDPEIRARGLRSMALLDSYEGHYRSAEERFEEAILQHRSRDEWMSEARVLQMLSMVRDGLGDRVGLLRDLERAVAILGDHEPQAWMLARIGVAFSRAGALEPAADLLELVRLYTDQEDPEQSADLNRLEGELELARKNTGRALELLELAKSENDWPLTLESLARAHRIVGQSEKAVAAYEMLVTEQGSFCIGWEAQQPWIEAHLHLAMLYKDGGERDKAMEVLGVLLGLWSDADPDLPLLHTARRLHGELAAEDAL